MARSKGPKGPDERLVRLSEAEAERLVRLYIEAELEILRELDRAMAKGNDLRYLRGMLENVQAILEDLLDGSRTWCEQAIPRIYMEGVKYADKQLKELGETISAGFGAVHQHAVKVLADNTFDRLENVAQVIGRRAEDVYRQYALEATRQSIIGYKTWKQVASEYRDKLRAEGITGFRDAKNRRWNMKTYAQMVARTTTMEAHLQGTANRLLEHGHDLVKVSNHPGECPKCRPWEGKVLSLTGKTPGYPTLQEAKDAGLFHPNCKHAYGLYIDLDREIEELERELGQHGVEMPELTEEARKGVIAAFTQALEHGLKFGTECILTVDAKSGQLVYNKITGSKNQVTFPQEFVDFLGDAADDSIILVHNHPGSSSFSGEDLANLKFRSLKGLGIIGHDKTQYYVGAKEGTQYDPDKIIADWRAAYARYFDYYKEQVSSGKMTPEQAWKEHSHKIIEDVAKANGFEYRRWLPHEE